MPAACTHASTSCSVGVAIASDSRSAPKRSGKVDRSPLLASRIGSRRIGLDGASNCLGQPVSTKELSAELPARDGVALPLERLAHLPISPGLLPEAIVVRCIDDGASHGANLGEQTADEGLALVGDSQLLGEAPCDAAGDDRPVVEAERELILRAERGEHAHGERHVVNLRSANEQDGLLELRHLPAPAEGRAIRDAHHLGGKRRIRREDRRDLVDARLGVARKLRDSRCR